MTPDLVVKMELLPYAANNEFKCKRHLYFCSYVIWHFQATNKNPYDPSKHSVVHSKNRLPLGQTGLYGGNGGDLSCVIHTNVGTDSKGQLIKLITEAGGAVLIY